MQNLVKAMVGFAALGFALAVIGVFTGGILGIAPESFSRACTNLALLGIAFSMVFKES